MLRKQDEMANNLAFVKAEFEKFEQLHNITPPSKLSAENLFKQMDGNEQVDTAVKNGNSYMLRRVVKRAGTACAAVLVLLFGFFAFRGAADIAVDESLMEEKDSDQAVDEMQTVDATRMDIDTVPIVLSDFTLGEIGYELDTEALQAGGSVEYQLEEKELIAETDGKSVEVSHIFSVEKNAQEGYVYVGETEVDLNDLGGQELLEFSDKTVYMVDEFGGKTLEDRMQAEGLNETEQVEVRDTLQNLRENPDEFINAKTEVANLDD